MQTQEQQNNNQSSNSVTTNEQQVRTTKWLAVLGFVALVVALAWFLFTAIAFVPNLVSLAGSAILGEEQLPEPTEIILTPSDIIAQHDSSLTLTWEATQESAGSFAIWFACVDGVDIAVATPDDGRQNINCDTYYNIGDRTSINAFFSMPDMENTQIQYEVAFVPEDDEQEQGGSVGTLTIENTALAMREEDEDEDQDDAIEEDDEDEVAVSPEPPTATTPPFREEIVYEVPQSDPRGTTDLGIRFTGVGVLENETFRGTRAFAQSERGAIRFAVTNHGTRTSETWTYTAELPNGQIYESPTQEPLRPNETATISLGFRAPAETGSYPFAVGINTSRDVNTNNHNFSWSVTVE